MRLNVIAFLLLVFAGGRLWAADVGLVDDVVQAQPDAPPVATARLLVNAPEIDGEVLADDAWRDLTPIRGFWQTRPFEGQPATQPTEVFFGYTADTLYIGVMAYDDNPEGIIVSDSRRDTDLEETDSFTIILDGFRDRQNGLVFGTNPAGIEYDGQVTREGSSGSRGAGSGFNLEWDTAWSVKAKISDLGWSAEFAIPFKSLRYGAGEVQTWGVNFQRNIRRNNEIAFWAPLPSQHNLYRVSQAGVIEDIVVPSQRNLKLTPYLLGKASRGGAIDGTDYDTEAGLDLKYSITKSLTLDATYNTDFAQVEVDDFQVNLDRFSVFLPEKRPFFLENAGQFSVGVPREVELFFSRRIGIGADGVQIPIDGGVRLSGKIGQRTNVGLLHMRASHIEGLAPENDFSVARVSQELPNRSTIGAIVVNRQGDGSQRLDGDQDRDYNRTYGVDGRWGIGDDLTLSAFAAKTDTPGLSGQEHAFRVRGDFNAQRWSSRLSYTEVGDNFNPEVGFLTRDDYRRGEAFVMYRHRPADLWGLHELRPHIAYRSFWDFDGFHETGWIHVDNHWEWRNGGEIHTGVNFTHEGVKEAFEIVDGVVVEPGSYDNEELALVFRTNQGAPLSLDLNIFAGGFFGGDRFTATPTVRYRIGETFNTELSVSHNDVNLPTDNFVLNLSQLRVTYSFTPKISLQALVQHNDRDDVLATNIRFAWQRTANAGLYLVYNEVDEDGLGPRRREFIVKYSRIFDVLN